MCTLNTILYTGLKLHYKKNCKCIYCVKVMIVPKMYYNNFILQVYLFIQERAF